jgi:hypothetical protein
MLVSFTYLRPGRNGGLRMGEMVKGSLRVAKNGRRILTIIDHEAGGRYRSFNLDYVRDFRTHNRYA